MIIYEDSQAPNLNQDNPMVIFIKLVEYEVSKVLVNQGNSVNIL